MTNPKSNMDIAPASGSFRDEMIWQQLKTVRDPEIPVNIVDLGLIYAAAAVPVEGGKRVEVRMSLTAPGCTMSDVIKAEVERKLAALPEVSEVKVDVVFDPPWNPGHDERGSKAAAWIRFRLRVNLRKYRPGSSGSFQNSPLTIVRTRASERISQKVSRRG